MSNPDRGILFDAFGARLWIRRADGGWSAAYVGSDGISRPAHDIVIPADIPESQLATYLFDLLHEAANPRHPDVIRIDPLEP